MEGGEGLELSGLNLAPAPHRQAPGTLAYLRSNMCPRRFC